VRSGPSLDSPPEAARFTKAERKGDDWLIVLGIAAACACVTFAILSRHGACLSLKFDGLEISSPDYDLTAIALAESNVRS
jgi:hypothetical protein